MVGDLVLLGLHLRVVCFSPKRPFPDARLTQKCLRGRQEAGQGSLMDVTS